jgi:hypothetical protein
MKITAGDWLKLGGFEKQLLLRSKMKKQQVREHSLLTK